MEEILDQNAIFLSRVFLVLVRLFFPSGGALSHECGRHVEPSRTRMLFGDMRRKAVGWELFAAEPAEGLTGRDMDALHSQPE